MVTREYDVVLFGATGFVGKLTAAHLAAHAGDGVKIALAGRSKDRLGAVRDSLGAQAADWPLVVADSSDAAQVRALAESTTAVATTVGPYAEYGMPLLAACAEAGTNYCDLTGEVLFVREAIDRHHAAAQRSGARIVNSCGFDSIPSDLGILALSDAAGDEFERVVMVVDAMRGGVSGGTVASLLGQLAVMRSSKEARQQVLDPYTLSPDRDSEAELGRQLDLMTNDSLAGEWVAPFFMGPYNTRIVRRSNALLGFRYGKALRYGEVMGMGAGPLGAVKAAALTGATGVGMGALSVLPRTLVDRVVPAPGEGPGEAARERGFFRISVHGRTVGGLKFVAKVAAKGDPGYGATAVMFGEAALALALDTLPDEAGVLTPAVAMGAALSDRLRARGFTISASAA